MEISSLSLAKGYVFLTFKVKTPVSEDDSEEEDDEIGVEEDEESEDEDEVSLSEDEEDDDTLEEELGPSQADRTKAAK